MMANVEILIGEATCAPVNPGPDTLEETAKVCKTIIYNLLVYMFCSH